MTRPAVLVSCLSSLESSPLTIAFREMAEALNDASIDLFVASKTQTSEIAPAHFIELPQMEDASEGKGDMQDVSSLFDPQEFLSLADIWETNPEHIPSMLAGWMRIFEDINPAAVLCWGTTHPHSRAMLRIAQRRMLPLFIIERGHVPSTIMVSPMGQGMLAPPGCDPKFYDSVSSANLRQWPQLASHLSSLFSVPGRFDECHAENGTLPKQGKRVLFLGCYDDGAGIGFEAKGAGQPYFSGLKSSFDAARAIVEATSERTDIQLVLRPHPFDKSDYESLANGDDRISVSRYNNLDQLMAASDVVVGIGSTANFGAFVAGIPLITMTASEFDGVGATYPCAGPGQLDEVLNEALYDAQSIDSHLCRGRLVVVSMLSDYLYQFGSGQQITKKRVSDFATWIARISSLTQKHW